MYGTWVLYGSIIISCFICIVQSTVYLILLGIVGMFTCDVQLPPTETSGAFHQAQQAPGPDWCNVGHGFWERLRKDVLKALDIHLAVKNSDFPKTNAEFPPCLLQKASNNPSALVMLKCGPVTSWFQHRTLAVDTIHEDVGS